MARTDDENDDGTDADRDTAIEFEGGGLYIYDRENEAAWIQSESAVALDRMA